MSKTADEGAFQARSPEEWAAKTIHYGRPCKGPEGMGRELGLCAFCQALAEDFRVAMGTATPAASPPDPLLEELQSLRAWRKEAEALLGEALDTLDRYSRRSVLAVRIATFLDEGEGTRLKAAPK